MSGRCQVPEISYQNPAQLHHFPRPFSRPAIPRLRPAAVVIIGSVIGSGINIGPNDYACVTLPLIEPALDYIKRANAEVGPRFLVLRLVLPSKTTAEMSTWETDLASALVSMADYVVLECPQNRETATDWYFWKTNGVPPAKMLIPTAHLGPAISPLQLTQWRTAHALAGFFTGLSRCPDALSRAYSHFELWVDRAAMARRRADFGAALGFEPVLERGARLDVLQDAENGGAENQGGEEGRAMEPAGYAERITRILRTRQLVGGVGGGKRRHGGETDAAREGASAAVLCRGVLPQRQLLEDPLRVRSDVTRSVRRPVRQLAVGAACTDRGKNLSRKRTVLCRN